jgi:hypothetical protein
MTDVPDIQRMQDACDREQDDRYVLDDVARHRKYLSMIFLEVIAPYTTSRTVMGACRTRKATWSSICS